MADGAAAARPRGTNLGLIEGPVFFLNIELMVALTGSSR